MHLRHWIIVLLMLGTFGCRSTCRKCGVVAPPAYLAPVPTATVAPVTPSYAAPVAPNYYAAPSTPVPIPTAPSPQTNSNRLPEILTPDPVPAAQAPPTRREEVARAVPAQPPLAKLLMPELASPEPPLAKAPIREPVQQPEPTAPAETEARKEPPAADPLPQKPAKAEPGLPVSIADFADAVPGKVSVGRQPGIEAPEWLAATGYRTVLNLRRPGTSADGDRKLFESRGLAFRSIEVGPERLTPAVVAQFRQLIGSIDAQPLFIYDQDGSLTGGLLYLHYRSHDALGDDAAIIRARLRPEQPAHAAMIQAVRAFHNKQ